MSGLYVDKDLEQCLNKFVPLKYREDFKQDLFEILIKYPDKIIEVNNQGKLKFYVVRCIISLSTQKRNLLQTNYIKKETLLLNDWHTNNLTQESYPFEIRLMKERKEDELIKKIKDSEQELCTPYYRLLSEALMINGTAGKVAKATGIPKSSVQQGIKKIRQYLSNE